MNKNAFSIFLGSLVLTFQLATIARQPLTFEERVKAQEAIERVFYNHRIWPKENPAPKPPFEQMAPKAQIEAKVTDYLKKSAALGQFWQRPIQSEQLQAEMDRMAKGTKDPVTLKELFAALNNDPYLIAECLAKPVLADRLIRNWYANDERFHGKTKTQAEAALAESAGGSLSLCSHGNYQKIVYVLSNSEESPLSRETLKRGEIPLDAKRFEREFRQAPDEGKCAVLKEIAEAFLLVRTALKTDNRVELETVSFPKRSLDEWLKTVGASGRLASASSASYDFVVPTFSAIPCGEGWYNGILDDVPDPRASHTAVWTGTEMIVWGGAGAFVIGLNNGGRYSPITDTWSSTSMGTSCPAGRSNHTAIWTGTEMVVWGGYDGSFLNTGGRYDPTSDTWTATSTATNCPSGRENHTAIWTGSEMIVWGGDNYFSYFNDGARYSPSTNTWTATSAGQYCPSARASHTAIWTGSQMIIWGGGYYDTAWHYFNTGGEYNPAMDHWTETSLVGDCPSGRSYHTAVWTGAEMIIWGGLDTSQNLVDTGARYNPSTKGWIAIGAFFPPSPRLHHRAVWTGTEMIVWGGCSYSCLNTGGRYNPSSDSWVAVSTGANCPGGRYSHTAVWTGSEMIVWGGAGPDSLAIFNSGGRYSPSTDTWIPTGIHYPSNPGHHTAVWTGTEIIVWGGDSYDGTYHLINTGGRYKPSLDSWTPTSVEAGCPACRENHTAVWTGTEMIVWGGAGSNGAWQSGGRYNPAIDSWKPTSDQVNCPSARACHSAVWTGSEMFVWGGVCGAPMSFLNTGGRYNPSTDAWLPIPTGAQCPSGRSNHTAVWTGSEMIVWGGYYNDGINIFLNDGGCYSPSTDSWRATATGNNCPSVRADHTTVWTGSRMIVWGGANDVSKRNTGGLYDPSTDSWIATSTDLNCPSARSAHTGVWTAREMIIWGGNDADGQTNSGGRYDPSSNDWVATLTGADCPAGSDFHTALWIGNGMIIWRGSSGGRYVPPIFVSPSILPGGMVGMSYGQTLAASYGTSPYTFAVTSGSLPPGLALFSGGGLLGAPTSSGSFSFTITATDSNGCAGTRDYSINIAPAAPPGETAPGDVQADAQTWSSKSTIIWPSNLLATGYNVYRGTQAGLPNLLTSAIDSCVKYSGSATSAAANDDPTWVAGGFYWYLVTGTNANGEGPTGNATAGARIVNSSGTCP